MDLLQSYYMPHITHYSEHGLAYHTSPAHENMTSINNSEIQFYFRNSRIKHAISTYVLDGAR